VSSTAYQKLFKVKTNKGILKQLCNELITDNCELKTVLWQRHPLLHSGDISRAIRRICVISAPVSKPPAATKCQFGGFSRVSRRTIQRKYCKICNNCNNNFNIYHILNS